MKELLNFKGEKFIVDRSLLTLKVLPQIASILGFKEIYSNVDREYIMVSPTFKVKVKPEKVHVSKSKAKLVLNIEDPLKYGSIIDEELTKYNYETLNVIFKTLNFKPLESGEPWLVNVLPWGRVEILKCEDLKAELVKLPPMGILRCKNAITVELEECSECMCGRVKVDIENSKVTLQMGDLWWTIKCSTKPSILHNGSEGVVHVKCMEFDMIGVRGKFTVNIRRPLKVEVFTQQSKLRYYTNMSYYELDLRDNIVLNGIPWAYHELPEFGGLCFTVGNLNVEISSDILKFKGSGSTTITPYTRTSGTSRCERCMLEHYHGPIMVKGLLEGGVKQVLLLTPESTSTFSIGYSDGVYSLVIYNFSSKPTAVKVKFERFVKDAHLAYDGKVYFKGKVVVSNVNGHSILPLTVKLLE